jgi:F-type H+-transporting ATPase subunit gamma
MEKNQDKEILFYAVGRKGRDFFKRSGCMIQKEYTNIFNQLSYTHAEIIGNDLIETFLREKLSKVLVVYNEFKSVIQQRLMAETLLPLQRPSQMQKDFSVDFLYEPKKEEIFQALLPRFVKSQIFRILLESFAAELGARMTAMDSATKNAKELIEHLTLKLNRTRQAMITREIAELVGGAEALKT